ncbi:2Fe-2S iron-sulfur cluster-binding protein [Rhizobium lentis]|uniref:2Fe-2S iron-sulfur cluster-binding protein n=1 Tax=Rhizobium lentis TaxID=1138194 RepID=UPI001AED388F
MFAAFSERCGRYCFRGRNSTNVSRSCQHGKCGTCKTKLSIGQDQSMRYLIDRLLEVHH